MPGVGCFLGFIYPVTCSLLGHGLRGACVLLSLLGMVGIDTCVGRSASFDELPCTHRAATGHRGIRDLAVGGG